MTRKELDHVEKVLLRIKEQERGEVQLALNYVRKDILLRKAQRNAQLENLGYNEHYDF